MKFPVAGMSYQKTITFHDPKKNPINRSFAWAPRCAFCCFVQLRIHRQVIRQFSESGCHPFCHRLTPAVTVDPGPLSIS